MLRSNCVVASRSEWFRGGFCSGSAAAPLWHEQARVGVDLRSKMMVYFSFFADESLGFVITAGVHESLLILTWSILTWIWV